MDSLRQVLTADWLQWLLAIEIIGLAALPLAAFLFRSFPDRGYGFTKPLGLLLVAFVNWWLGSTVGAANIPGLLWLLCAALAAGGILLYLLRVAERPLNIRPYLRTIAIEEVVFLAAFIGWTFVRSLNPDIYSTEKPMDFMLLQVSSMSQSFPPPDAWLSGHTVNYYYLGYAIFAMIGRMANVDPRIGFNLSNITIFALGCSGAFSLSLALTKRWVWGIAGAFALMLAGNLDGIAQAISQLQNGGLNASGLSLWCSTRIIDGGCNPAHSITEFPIFSLLWNDLHPHVMAIPFVLLAIGFGVHGLVQPPAGLSDRAPRYLQLGVAAIALGALFPINSWDYPAYTVFVVGAMLLGLRRTENRSSRAFGETLAIVPASLVVYAPYFLTVHNSKGIGLLAHPTGLGDMLTVIGGLLIPVTAFVLWQAGGALLSEAREQRNNESTMHRVFQALPAGFGWWAVFGIVLVFIVWSARTDFLYIVLLVAGLYALLARVRQDDPEPQAALLLAIVSIAVLFAGDFAYLRDVFDNSPLYRMNTVFKLMYQAWILLAIAAPFSVFLIGKSLRKLQSRVPYIVWYASAVVLAVGLAVYPIEGVASQAPAMPSPSTLDGLQYVRDVAPHEYAAINWVRQHTAPTDVVAEAYGGDYWVSGLDSSPNKMSALSGRPTLIGWPGSHEALWRGDFGGGADAVAAGAMLTQREGDVRTLYTSTDAQTAIKLIRQYRIAYVYVGPFEQTTYGGSPAGLQKFKTFLVPVVQFPYVTLYKVPASLLKG